MWPRVMMCIYPPGREDVAVSPTQEDIIAEMADWQNKMFSARNGPEVEIEVKVKNDEAGAGVFKFKGLITGPSYTFTTRNAALQIECVPEYAQVDSLAYSIYKPPSNALYMAADPNLAVAGTICNLITLTQKKLRENFTPEVRTGAADEQYAIAQHKINEKVVQYFEELLTASDSEEVFGWTEVVGGLVTYGDENLRSAINSCLLQSSGPFCGVIDRLAETFGCLCVHKWDKIGLLLNKYNLMNKVEDLSLDILSISINATSGFGLLPPGFVGVISPYYNPGDLPMEPSNHFVVYPKENAEQGVGVMQQTMGPSWVNDIVVSQAVTNASARDKGLKVEEAQDKVEDDVENKEKSVQNALNILELWGKSAYINHALQNSTVSLQVPLTFKPEVGKYYNVKTNKQSATEPDVVLFKGLLANVTHSITVDGGSPQAMTSLVFTHVQLEGFYLPFVD